MTRTRPYLIQRIRREDRAGRTGADAKFRMDYMGSAEFEFGALPASLKEMRAEKMTGPTHIKSNTGEVAWFVGPERVAHVAADLFFDQIKPQKERKLDRDLKELTRIRQSYTGKGDWGGRDVEKWERFDGWWCVDEGLPFVLFRDEQHARDWLECLGVKK